MSTRTPAQAAGRTALGITAAVIAAIIIIALVIVGWQVGWWFNVQNVNRQAQLNQHQYNVQLGYIQAVQNDVQTVDSLIVQMATAPDPGALRSQAIQAGDQACSTGSLIIGNGSGHGPGLVYPPSEHDWLMDNCSNGSLSLASPVMKGTGN